jgi:toxin ParE1/3/4
MTFEVVMTAGAVTDLEEITEYIAEYDSPENAARVLDRLEKVLRGLAEFPDRGSHPKELLELGIREYRQVFFKPYRMIYRVIGKDVYVHIVADGRRDMQSLLGRRLLGS